MFLTPIDMSPLQDRDGWWRVDRLILYRSVVLAEILEIPTGFVTDGSSVPRAPFAYWLCGGRGFIAGVVHDFTYRAQRWPQSLCDQTWYEVARLTRVNVLAAWLMYRALRAEGHVVFNRYAAARRRSE